MRRILPVVGAFIAITIFCATAGAKDVWLQIDENTIRRVDFAETTRIVFYTDDGAKAHLTQADGFTLTVKHADAIKKIRAIVTGAGDQWIRIQVRGFLQPSVTDWVDPMQFEAYANLQRVQQVVFVIDPNAPGGAAEVANLSIRTPQSQSLGRAYRQQDREKLHGLTK